MRALMGLIKNRHGTYCAQQRVPARLQAAVAQVLRNGKARQVYLKKSLGTKDLRAANVRAKPIQVGFDRVLGQAEQLLTARPLRASLSAIEIKRMVEALFGKLLADDEAWRFGGRARMAQAEAQLRREGVEFTPAYPLHAQQEQADRWPRYLSAGCHRRGWSSSGLGQIDRAENSGTITITANGQPQLDIVWERKRDRPMKVRARLASRSHLSLAEAGLFFEEVNESCGSAVTEPIYVRGTLQYDGLAWRGELWLDDKTRLAPPSLQDETAVIGPRIVHVDAILECVGQPDVAHMRQQMLLEVSAFLSVAMRKAIRLADQGRVWVWTADLNGCEVRNLGYLEPANPLSMPIPGTVKPVPLYALDNPPRGIDGSTNEISLRNDIADLWKLYRSLGAEQRV
jgi:hypothetical protein